MNNRLSIGIALELFTCKYNRSWMMCLNANWTLHSKRSTQSRRLILVADNGDIISAAYLLPLNEIDMKLKDLTTGDGR